MRPKLSIIIPIHDMQHGAKFLWASINALMAQSFQDFEIVITKQGTMPENTNAGIRKAKGELIKILYLDDRLAHKDALKEIVESFDKSEYEWLITGANDNLFPYYTDDIEKGNNKLGSPSALTIRNVNPLLFDEKMTWLLDCDYYKRMHERFGEPMILDGEQVIIGKHQGQMTHILTDDQKILEVDYMKSKHAY